MSLDNTQIDLGTAKRLNAKTASDAQAQLQVAGAAPDRATLADISAAPMLKARALAQAMFIPFVANKVLDFSQSGVLQLTDHAGSWYIRGPDGTFSDEMVGMELVGPGIAAGTIIGHVFGTFGVWVNQNPGTTASGVQCSIVPIDQGSRRTFDRSQQGYWEAIYDSRTDGVGFAAEWGVSPLKTAEQNKAALQQCLDDCYANGIYTLQLPMGRLSLAPGIHLSPNMRVIATGLTWIDTTGAGQETMFTVSGSNDFTNDFLGQAFEQSHRAGMYGIIFYDFSNQNQGRALFIGNTLTSDATAACYWTVHQCSFIQLNIGMELGNNLWGGQYQYLCFSHCNQSIVHSGIHNSGENLSFSFCLINGSKIFGLNLAGFGAGLTFHQTSFDSNNYSIHYGGPGYNIGLFSCWMEYDGNSQIIGENGVDHSKSSLSTPGTFFIPHPGAQEPIGEGLYALLVKLGDFTYFRGGDKNPYIAGGHTAHIAEGQKTVRLPMMWCSSLWEPVLTVKGPVAYATSVDCPPPVGQDANGNQVLHNYCDIYISPAAGAGGVDIGVRY